jgi:plastocyanin
VKALALVLLGTFALAGSAPTRMQVVAREFSLSVSRVQLKPGTTVIELANFGQDPHDLRLQRIGSRHIAGTGIVKPGEREELTADLAPGRYALWCSIGDHRRRGMRATITVRSR